MKVKLRYLVNEKLVVWRHSDDISNGNYPRIEDTECCNRQL
jgi:hypothetical protein